MRKHEETIREKKQFYENEIENNKEQERKISFSERTAAKLRSDHQALETERDQFQSEVSPSNVSLVWLVVLKALTNKNRAAQYVL